MSNRSAVAAWVALSLVVVPVRAGEPGAGGASSVEDRLAALEAKLAAEAGPTTAPATLQAQLRAANARIAQLEQRVRSLEAGPKGDAKADAAKPAAKAVADADAPMPQGSKWSGTFTNAGGNHAIGGTVVARTKDAAVLRLTNEYGTREWDIVIDNGNARIRSQRALSTKFGNALKNIDVSGTVDADSLKLNGTWVYQGAAGGGTESVRFDLTSSR